MLFFAFVLHSLYRLMVRGVDPLDVSSILLVLPHYCYATVTEASISLRCLPFVLDNTTICFASWVFLYSSIVTQNMPTLSLFVYSIGTEYIVFTTKLSYFLISLLGIQCSRIRLIYRFYITKFHLHCTFSHLSLNVLQHVVKSFSNYRGIVIYIFNHAIHKRK